VTRESTAIRQRLRPSPRLNEGDSGKLSFPERLAAAGALGAVGLFLGWFLLRAGAVTDALYSNPDFASSLVIAQFLDDRGSGEVVLGNYVWLAPLYAMDLTRWLPEHREVWEAAPFVLYVVTVTLVGWTVSRAVSGRAGSLVALAMAAPAPIVLAYVAVPNAHAHSLLGVAILAGFLVTFPKLAGWSWARRGLWALGLAITSAVGASSDVLFLIGGAFPFLLAVVFGWRRAGMSNGVTALAIGAALAGVGAGGLLALAAEHAGVRGTGASFPLASPSDAAANARQLLEDLALFAHGRLSDTSDAIDVILELIGIAAMVGIPVLVIAILIRSPAVLRDRRRPPTQRLLFVYWGAALAGLAVAFVFSSAPEDIGSTRYTIILWPALLTLPVIVFARRALAPIALLAALAGVLGCVELARGTYTDESGFPSGDLSRLERFVAAKGLDHGYAAYVNAPVITARTDFDVRTYPVERCGLEGDGRCPFGLHRIDAWYQPMRRARSFYLVAERPGWPRLGAPPTRWGPPAAEARFGLFHVFAYDFDLARVLMPGATAPQSRFRAERGRFPRSGSLFDAG
jgi:hypothetical protein